MRATPLGMLSLADIVRATDRQKGRAPREVAPEEVAGTLADICATAPREPNRAAPRAALTLRRATAGPGHCRGSGQCVCLRHVQGPARVHRPRRHLRLLGGEQLQQARRPGSGGAGAVVAGRERLPAPRRPGPEPGRDREGRRQVREGHLHGRHRGARPGREVQGNTRSPNDPAPVNAVPARRRTSCRRRCRG